jgi:DNA-binding HxlR family transcriptional regulator
VPDLDAVPCAIERSLAVLGERWTLLILREAFLGATRFAEFRDNLGVASDILTDRLNTLVEHGVLTKEPYRDPGRRTRYAYHLAAAGEQLVVVLHALQQWGDDHLPLPDGPTVVRHDRRTGRPVHVGYLDDRGRAVPTDRVGWTRPEAEPT